MGTDEQWKIKVSIKDSRLCAQVGAAINKTFDLYRCIIQYGVLPVLDSQESFHLAYTDEKKTKNWIELFIKSVTGYINAHFPDAHLQCSVKDNVLTFKKVETKNDKSS